MLVTTGLPGSMFLLLFFCFNEAQVALRPLVFRKFLYGLEVAIAQVVFEGVRPIGLYCVRRSGLNTRSAAPPAAKADGGAVSISTADTKSARRRCNTIKMLTLKRPTVLSANYQITHADTTITRVTIKSGLSFQDHNVILNMIN